MTVVNARKQEKESSSTLDQTTKNYAKEVNMKKPNTPNVWMMNWNNVKVNESPQKPLRH